MAIVNDDGVHDDGFEATVNSFPEDIRRVYITAKADAEKPADALKPTGDSTLPVTFSDTPGDSYSNGIKGQWQGDTFYPTPDYADVPPSWLTVPKAERPPAKVMFNLKNGYGITDHDIEDATNVALSAGPGSLTGKFDNYINSFVNKAKQDIAKVPEPKAKPIEPELDPTEKALKAIQEILDGPGAYEKDVAAQALKKAKTESGVPYKPMTNEEHYQEFFAPKKTIPITESSKKTILDYEQTANGKFEVFDPWSAKVHAKVNSKEEAEAFIKNSNAIKDSDDIFKQVPFEHDVLEGWSPTKPVGHTGHSFSPQEAAAEYKVMKGYENQVPAEALWNDYANKATTAQWKEFTKLTGGNKYVDTPKTDKAMEDIKHAIYESKEHKLSPFDKIANKLQEIQAKALNKYIQEQAQRYHEAAKQGIRPEAVSKGYDTPAYRGLRIHEGMEVSPINDFAKNDVMYSSDTPLLADMYASYLSKHPGWKVKEGAFDSGAQVVPLYINTKDYHVFDAQGRTWQEANNIAMREARDLKKKGVIVQNVWDEPNSTKALGKPNTVYITFSSGAGTVKSRFAKEFQESSPNMLHMIPVIGVGGAAGYVSFGENTE